jgi:hypothetical protein
MKSRYFSYEKRCNCKIIWMRYNKKKKTFGKTKKMKKEDETILKSEFTK